MAEKLEKPICPRCRNNEAMCLNFDTQRWHCNECDTYFSTPYLEGWNEGLKVAKEQIEELESTLESVRSLGEVYVYPENWNSFKAGGPPSIEDYEKVDLSDYGA